MDGRASGSRSQYGTLSHGLERLSLDSHDTYEVQHLKTFTSEPGGTPPGMTQAVEILDYQVPAFVHNYRMLIRKERSEAVLSILDPWMGNQEVEWFPIRIIRAPRFKTDASKHSNNNLFMFKIDAHAFKRNEPPSNELHVFQVLSCPAQEIVDQLISLGADPDYSLIDNRVETPEFATSRRIASNGLPRRSIQTPTFSQSPRVRTASQSNLTLRSNSLARPSGTLPNKDHEDYRYNIDISAEEISTSLINAEVLLLNYCFDDIEEVIQLMRDRPVKNRRKSSVAISTASLNRSRNRLQSRGSIIPRECSTDPNFRLTVQDFFQKIKFAAILLSRLSDYVKEPKAPILIRKVFDLLKEGVNICRQPKSNRADIPRNIVYPRFPKETLKFLEANLTAEQEAVLRELGPAWNTPREETMDDDTVYVPNFRNGFEVDRDVYDPTLFCYNSEYVDTDPQRRYIQTARLSRYAKDLMSRGADLAKVIMTYRARTSREISVQIGEYLELLDESRDWYRVRNSDGLEGYCPNSVLRKIERISGIYQPRGSIFLHRGDSNSRSAF